MFLLVIQGIRERMDFLRDMENLGLEKKYRPIMQQEIAQKIRLIESMDKQLPDELQKEILQFHHERSSPKPFPLGELDEDWSLRSIPEIKINQFDGDSARRANKIIIPGS